MSPLRSRQETIAEMPKRERWNTIQPLWAKEVRLRRDAQVRWNTIQPWCAGEVRERRDAQVRWNAIPLLLAEEVGGVGCGVS